MTRLPVDNWGSTSKRNCLGRNACTCGEIFSIVAASTSQQLGARSTVKVRLVNHYYIILTLHNHQARDLYDPFWERLIPEFSPYTLASCAIMHVNLTGTFIPSHMDGGVTRQVVNPINFRIFTYSAISSLVGRASTPSQRIGSCPGIRRRENRCIAVATSKIFSSMMV